MTRRDIKMAGALWAGPWRFHLSSVCFPGTRWMKFDGKSMGLRVECEGRPLGVIGSGRAVEW